MWCLMYKARFSTWSSVCSEAPPIATYINYEISIFRVGMQSVNPSIKPFCNLSQEDDSSLATTALLAKLDRKRRDRWSEAVRSIDFSHSSRKAWSILNNLTGRSQTLSLPLSRFSRCYCISAGLKWEIRGC